MEREELVNRFNELLDTYEQHKAYGEKAREQASNFSSAVIEKVMADHQIKASLIADDITPLVAQVTNELHALSGAIDEAEQSKGDFGTRIEELELRKVIGEISDEEFDSLTSEGRETVESANQQIAGLEESRQGVQVALDRWTELSGNSTLQEPEDSLDSDPVVDAILPGFEEDGDSVEVEADDLIGFDIDESVDSVDVVEDEEADSAFEVEVEGDVEEGGDPDEDSSDEDSSDEDSSDEDSSDEDSSDDDSADDVADDVVDGDEDGISIPEPDGDSDIASIGVDMSEEGSEDSSDEDGPRRAILLSNEGTPDEQIYALTGEVFTVGRGRDNDLQIKNDSKVSRFHCKLYRRGANYYLEDNKSSNGTMVNGELISERRLFGGEEVVIGETFFRFRVM